MKDERLLFQELMARTGEGIAFFDGGHQLAYVNTHLIDILQVDNKWISSTPSLEEFISRIVAIVPANSRNALIDWFGSHQAEKDAFEMRVGSGSVFTLRQVKSQLEGVILIFTDVTTLVTREKALFDANRLLSDEILERRAVQSKLELSNAQLSALNDRLKALNQEQAEFTYALSHDLRAPINTVSMLLSEVESEISESSQEDVRELISMANKTCARMGGTIISVLEYSKTLGESEGLEVVDLDTLLAEIVNDLQADISAAHAELKVVALGSVWGYPQQLRMLLQNLLANALKFRDTGKRLIVEIGLQELSDDNRVEIAVSDNGIGIEQQYQERIFALFQRLHNHSEYPGIGLGLALCRRIAENHGGMLNVESAPTRGATFRFTLSRFDTKNAELLAATG